MKRLILACFLLCLCARFSVAVPSPQSNFPASRESKCSKGFKECKESLKDFKDADEFMQTKATVFENSISTKSNSATARDAHVNRQKTGSGVVYGATVGPNRPSSGQATSAAQAALGESAAGTMSDKQMP